MKRTLEFIVDGQRLRKDPSSNFSGIVSGSKGYLECHFSFSGEWKSLRKAVQFKTGDSVVYKPVVDDKCQVPNEVTGDTRIHVSLIGKGASVYLTTNEAVILQKKGNT